MAYQKKCDSQESPTRVPPSRGSSGAIVKDTSGIALFMVMAAIGVLTMLVVEFSYVAQINQSIAYGALDQAKAHYLAKAGLKISLLRLKAYQQVKGIAKNMGGAAGAAGLPKSMIEKIWNFPFFYPFPTNIPGMTIGDKAGIEKFQKESLLDGKFTAVIESESSKFNLNTILPGSPTIPSPSPTPAGGTTPNTDPNANPAPSPSPAANPDQALFDPAAGRESLSVFLGTILDQKLRDDPDFAADYRDIRLPDLVDNIAAWSDRTYQRRTANRDKLNLKRAPFYSLNELHYLGTIDDDIFNLLAPSLTVSPTSGINVNTIRETALRALIPQMTKDDANEFFKFRDSETSDNMFATPDAFFNYLGSKVPALSNPSAIQQLKNDLQQRNIQIVTDEMNFKITVQATVNAATRTITAWVVLSQPKGQAAPGSAPGTSNSPDQQQPGAPPPISGPGPQSPTTGTDSGLKITFMTIQ